MPVRILCMCIIHIESAAHTQTRFRHIHTHVECCVLSGGGRFGAIASCGQIAVAQSNRPTTCVLFFGATSAHGQTA